MFFADQNNRDQVFSMKCHQSSISEIRHVLINAPKSFIFRPLWWHFFETHYTPNECLLFIIYNLRKNIEFD